jgi:hypothetical protein
MAEVRSHDGVPTEGDFGGIGSPSPGTPIVVNTQTGDLYVYLTGGVTKALSVSVVSGLLYGSGVPSGAAGSNGNFYFRSDGAAGTFIYHKAAGSWTAFA